MKILLEGPSLNSVQSVSFGWRGLRGARRWRVGVGFSSVMIVEGRHVRMGGVRVQGGFLKSEVKRVIKIKNLKRILVSIVKNKL